MAQNDASITSAPPVATDADVPLELRIAIAPRTAGDTGRLLEELTARLESLAPTTQPATSQPTTQPDSDLESQLDGWRIEHWKALLGLRDQLTEQIKTAQALDASSLDENVARLTESIGELRRKKEEILAAAVPLDVPQAAVDDARSVFESNNQALEALVATIAQQEALLRDGFAAQRARLQQDLRAAQVEREKVESSFEADMKAADSQTARDLVESRRGAWAARTVTLETSRVVVELKEKHTQQELEQNLLRRDALQPYVQALRDRMTALTEARSRSRAERLRARLDRADLPPLRRIFLQMQLLAEENTVRLQQEFAGAILERQQSLTIPALATAFDRDTRYWKDFSGSLSRRSAAEVLTAFKDAQLELGRARDRFRTLQANLDTCFSEERRILQDSRRVLDEFAALEAQFRELARNETDEETIKLTQQVGQTRLELRNAFETMLKAEQELIERLRQAMTIVEGTIALWERATSRLYWVHLITRGPTIFNPESFQIAQEDARAFTDGRLTAAVKDAMETARRRMRAVVMADWFVFGAISLVILYAALRLLRLCQRVRNEGPGDVAAGDSTEPSAPPFIRRLRYQLARAAVIPIPVFAVLGLVAAFTEFVSLTDTPRRLAYWFVFTVGGLTTGLLLISVALTAPKPRFRLIPCSRAVARYYRRFAVALVWICCIGLAPPYLAVAAGLTGAVPRQRGEWLVFLVNLVAIVFLLRKETVLGIFPRTERGRMAVTVATLRAVLPFLIFLMILLALMHVTGYHALAIYISIGLASSIGLALAAWVLYEFFREFVHWTFARFALARLQADAATSATAAAIGPADSSPAQQVGAGATAPSAPDSADGAKIESVPPPGSRLVLSIIRWALVIGVLVVSLSIWGIRPYEIKQILDFELWRHGDRPVTAWRLGGAILWIMVSVVFSRAVRQTLHSRFYPRHATIDRGAQASIDTLLHYGFIAIGIYAALQTLQLDFGALFVLFGGLGLGLGLGLQPLIVNFISGLLMLFERHVKVGDVVVVHDKLGEITKVSMRSTTVRTPDGIYLVIPNGEFINQKVENWTLDNKPIRGLVTVGVAYGTDPKRVKELLLELAFAEPKVRLDPPADVFFTEFGESSLNFSLACWFNNPPERWFGMLSLRYAISEKFREEGISIPFPQRTLSLVGDQPLRVQVFGADSVAARPSTDPVK